MRKMSNIIHNQNPLNIRHVPVVAEGRLVGIVSRFEFSGLELDRLDEETGSWERI
jgi:hypothetical protein